MTDNLYHVSGPGEVVFLGRNEELERIRSSVFRSVPTHISVTGPKLIGKSSLMKNIPDQKLCEENGFVGTLYWNIADDIPANDDAFFEFLYEKIRSIFDSTANELVDIMDPIASIKNDKSEIQETLESVFEELGNNNQKILLKRMNS